MAADVGLVAGAAERDADVLAPHRAGDRLGHRGLADAGRADEEQDRPAGGRGLGATAGRRRHRVGGLRAELAHREELEHPILDVAEGVVVLVEDRRGAGEVEVLLAARAPRQLGDRLEVGADDLRLHRLAVHPRQRAELAVDLRLRDLGQLEGGELLLQLGQAPVVVALAELLLDRLELLAQEHLPLAVAELLLDLRLDLRLGVEHGDLPLHRDQHTAQPLLDRSRLEQRLPLRVRQLDVRRHQVGEVRRLADLGEELAHGLLGQLELLAEPGGLRRRLAVEGDERGVRRIERRKVVLLEDERGEEAVLRLEAEHRGAPLAVQHELHPGRAALELADPGDGADREQALGGHLLDVLPLGDDEHRRSVEASAASTARTVAGRPAPIGALTRGKSTASRSGRTGNIGFSVISAPSVTAASPHPLSTT